MSCAASQVDGRVERQLHLHRILIHIRVFNLFFSCIFTWEGGRHD